MEFLRIATIEDNIDFRAAFIDFVAKQDALICLLECESCAVFLKSLKPYHQIDVLLLDIHLPNGSGISYLPKLRKALPNTHIIMYTVEENEDMLLKAFAKGADGYLLKSTDWDQLPQQLAVISEGGAVISPKMARALITYFNPKQKPKGHADLGDRDVQVLNLLAQGWSYEHIGKQLDMTVNGVRYYIRKLYKRLNVNSRHEATRKFLNNPDILRQI